jgi:hypothetical protein
MLDSFQEETAAPPEGFGLVAENPQIRDRLEFRITASEKGDNKQASGGSCAPGEPPAKTRSSSALLADEVLEAVGPAQGVSGRNQGGSHAESGRLQM